ncbi:MAG TPA: tRNA pseudouridine(38-40) synthase TruA [Acidimicrobiales bacterium]|nr:tRNA pseudouridine(38-40) synthase TruA [Acidimicrobiales bacterium]
MTLFSLQAGPAAQAAVTARPTVRVRMTVAYDGGGFHGFAAQPGQRTVAGVLAAALERHLRHAVDLTCAGRTDAGVHAWGQVVSFDARDDVDPAAMARAVTKALKPAVVVRSAERAPAGFDARFDATGRRYRYTVLNRSVADPFLAATSWHVERPLDLPAMRLACDPLHGEHDFASFCRRPPQAGGSTVRVVRHAGWSDLGDGVLRFEIAASSFCQQMVRSVVGLLVDVGTGKRRAGEVSGVIRAATRSAAGQIAPPQGLCLWSVDYPPDDVLAGDPDRHAVERAARLAAAGD